MKKRAWFIYRSASLAMAAVFAVVGMIFLLWPGAVLEFFNRLSPLSGLATAPPQPGSFYPALAVAYMALVTALAWLMFRKPGNPLPPQLLALGKSASALVSLYFFFGGAPYLVCLANAVADGAIASLALGLLALQKKHSASWPT